MSSISFALSSFEMSLLPSLSVLPNLTARVCFVRQSGTKAIMKQLVSRSCSEPRGQGSCEWWTLMGVHDRSTSLGWMSFAPFINNIGTHDQELSWWITLELTLHLSAFCYAGEFRDFSACTVTVIVQINVAETRASEVSTANIPG